LPTPSSALVLNVTVPLASGVYWYVVEPTPPGVWPAW
jgi:hypothetical protein